MALPRLVAGELPANMQVVLLSKLLQYEQSLSDKSTISIFVINNEPIYQAFNLLKAKQQNQQLGKITFGNQLPNVAYDIVYLHPSISLNEALIYSIKYKTLLISNDTERVKEGVTLGLGVKSGRPMFFINKKSSDAAGVLWAPSVLSIATIYD